jgi:predicted nucleic acid-binding protein
MIVVADSSPLIVLVNIGHVQILPTLFQEVFIPPQIAAELADPKRPQGVRDFIFSDCKHAAAQRMLSTFAITSCGRGNCLGSTFGE